MTDIRRLRPQDWRTFRDLRLRALRESPNAYGSTYENQEDYGEQHWRDWLSRDLPKLVASHDGADVALGSIFVTDDGWARVIAMWTMEQHRGHGHARAILTELVDWARERGHPVELHVNTANPSARRVYEGFGFVATGEREPLREGSDQQVERLVLP